MSNYQLISTPRWIWLATLVLAVVSGILYGIFGDVTRTVSAVGVTRQGEDLMMVTADRDGAIAEVLVEAGAIVRKGQVVVRYVTDEIDAELDRAQDRINLLTTESAALEKAEAATLQDANASRDALLQETDEIVAASNELLARRQQFLADQEDLLKDGLIAGETVLRSRAEVAELRNGIDSARSAAAAARLSVTRLETEIASARAARREQLALATAERRRLESRRLNEFTLRSDLDGRVQQVGVEVGGFVERGDRIIRLLPEHASSDELQILAFVPQATGKLAKPGDPVQIVPRFVDVSRYGYMRGRLTRIAEVATGPEELSLLLADPILVSTLLEKELSVLVARVDLELDPATPSGFKWSSIKGWPGTIDAGVVVDMNIVYAVDRPIELFLPWLRSLIGQ